MNRRDFGTWLRELAEIAGLLHDWTSADLGDWSRYYDAGFSPSEAWAARMVEV